MKSTFTFLFAILIAFSSYSQTATSVANGSWFNPLTWGGTVPTAGYTVIINHNVTMPSSWLQSGGSITINNGGSLIQDANRAIAFNGGTLVNHGTITFSKMAVFTGPMTNSGTLNANDSLFINAAVTNSGTINSANYLNGAGLTNSGIVIVTNLLNDGTISNSYNIIATDFFNNNITTNTGQIYLSNSTNAGILNNNIYGSLQVSNDFTNAGILNNDVYSSIQIYNNCTNGDSIGHFAYWMNNGLTSIQNDFTNIDTLDGSSTGVFCVKNNSANFGAVLGDFDFCDWITSGFGLNTGTISNSIVYCNNSLACFSGIKKIDILNIEFFPNPVKENLTIQFDGVVSNKTILIVNSCGQIVFEQDYYGTDEISISRNNLPSGLYLLRVSDGKDIITKKLIFE